MDYSYFGRNQKSRATRPTKSNLDTFSSQALWLNDLSMAEMQHHFEGPENFLRWHEDSHFPLSVSLYWSRSLYRNVSFAVGYERRKTCVCVLPVGFVPTKNGQSCKTQILAILQNWTFPFGAVAVWAQKRISAGLRSVKEIASGLWWALADDRCFASWWCVLCQLYKRVVCLQDIFEVQRTALNRRKRYTVDNPQVTYKVPEFDRRSSVPRKCLGLSWYASACDSTVWIHRVCATSTEGIYIYILIYFEYWMLGMFKAPAVRC